MKDCGHHCERCAREAALEQIAKRPAPTHVCGDECSGESHTLRLETGVVRWRKGWAPLRIGPGVESSNVRWTDMTVRDGGPIDLSDA